MGIKRIATNLLSVGVLSTLLVAGSTSALAAAPDHHDNDRDRWGHDDDRDYDRWGHNDFRDVSSSSYSRGYRDGFRVGFRDGREDAWSPRRDHRSLRRVDPRSSYDRGFAAAYERGYRQGIDSVHHRR